MKRRNRSAQAQASAPPKAVTTITKLKSQQPTHEQIQRRAYEISEARGEAPGTELSDWLQAERELKTELGEA